ncbi:MAG: acetolactate synthase large subunit [Acidimicrobiales bacterium]
MTGADAIVEALERHGITHCFTNPGTTELPLVEALARAKHTNVVLTLHEGVATGAADGFARVSGHMAWALLHLGPGLSNGASFLHDARRARTPLLCVIGEHASWHLPFDPPLASDIESLAAPVSVGVVRLSAPELIHAELASAIAMAEERRGPVVVIAPHDIQCARVSAESAYEGGDKLPNDVPRDAEETDCTALLKELAVQMDGDVLWLLGGWALDRSVRDGIVGGAIRLGHRVLLEQFPSVMRRGGGSEPVGKLPYFPDAVLGAVGSPQLVICVGTRPPVSFFGYEGTPSILLPEKCKVIEWPDDRGSLDDLVAWLEEFHSGDEIPRDPDVRPKDTLSVEAILRERATADPLSISAAIVRAQFEGDVIVDEGRTGLGPYFNLSHEAPSHTYLGHCGGAIGEGMPLGLGAALASPGRTVLVIQADGGGLYAPQTLWSMAHEGTPVIVVVLANDAYRILQMELARAGADIDETLIGLTALENPRVDWVQLAKGFGVEATSVRDGASLVDAIADARRRGSPALIEVRMTEPTRKQ